MKGMAGAVTCRCSWVGDGHSHGQPRATSRAPQGSSIHCPWEAHPDVCHSPAGHGETEQSCWYNFSQCSQCPFSVSSQGPSWFGGCGQEKVAGWEGQWVRMWLGPLSEGHGGGLDLTWMGRTALCPQPGMMCFSYLVKKNVECKR